MAEPIDLFGHMTPEMWEWMAEHPGLVPVRKMTLEEARELFPEGDPGSED